MKSAGKYWLLASVALAPRVAFAESVTQFAPVEDGTAATSRPTSTPHPSSPPLASAPPPSSSPPPATPDVVSTSSPPIQAPRPATETASSATTLPSLEPVAPPNDARTLALRPTSTEGVSDTPAQERDDDAHYVSLSFSVARAVASLYEVTGEVALGRHFGLALLGGVGSLEAKHPEYDQTVELTGKELGAQARIYVLGSFDHGLMLGGEALQIWADVSPTQVTDPAVVTINGMPYGGTATLSGEGTLTGLAAFIGYKVIASFGLTLDAKLGWQSLTLTGTGRIAGEAPINGQSVPVSESGTIRENRGVPLFNLNLGWSI